MTFDFYEKSQRQAEPVELYTIANGVDFYYYTSADHDVVHATKTFVAYPMRRSTIETTGEKGRNNLTINASDDIPVAAIFKVQPPSEVVSLVVSRLHEVDPAAEAGVIWVGRILSAKWNKGEVVFSCEPVTGSLTRPGLRRLSQRQCPHPQYGAKCGLNKNTYKVTTSVTVSGITLSHSIFDGYPDGYFAGGYVEFDLDSGNVDRRFIQAHTGPDLTIGFPSTDLVTGITVRAYPGCDHTIGTCFSKYGNNANYGGMPFVPQKDPMAGSSF